MRSYQSGVAPTSSTVAAEFRSTPTSLVTSIADFDNRATSTLQADGDTGLLDFKGKTVGQIEQMRDEGVIDALSTSLSRRTLRPSPCTARSISMKRR